MDRSPTHSSRSGVMYISTQSQQQSIQKFWNVLNFYIILVMSQALVLDRPYHAFSCKDVLLIITLWIFGFMDPFLGNFISTSFVDVPIFNVTEVE